MKCHYEVLGVQRDASIEELKKAYKKLALKWHPDKNLDNPDHATAEFRLVQQAFEVLVDPQERAWYDKHREAILRGGQGRGDEYTDESLDVYAYFNSSCYKGFGDDDEGFYAVYRKVFATIAEQDYVFMDDRESGDELPSFGNSQSDYNEVVHAFYSYWQSYCTAKSYVWMEKYDPREAPDRRTRRLTEAENKKLRDAAKKERNDEVRALVAFVRKRDKRVLAYKQKLEERAVEIARLGSEKRKKQIQERLKAMENYQEASWSAMDELEDAMQSLEAELGQKFGDEDSGDERDDTEPLQEDDEDDLYDSLFCAACNKAFKTEKARLNHDKSKKHKENVAILRNELEKDDNEMAQYLGDICDSEGEEAEETTPKVKLSKKQKKKRRQQQSCDDLASDIDDLSAESPIEPVTNMSSEPAPEDTSGVAVDDAVAFHGVEAETEEESHTGNEPNNEQDNGKVLTCTCDDSVLSDVQEPKAKVETKCNTCHQDFKSRNKLFEHLKSTGHALRVDVNPSPSVKSGKKSKKKSKR